MVYRLGGIYVINRHFGYQVQSCCILENRGWLSRWHLAWGNLSAVTRTAGGPRKGREAESDLRWGDYYNCCKGECRGVWAGDPVWPAGRGIPGTIAFRSRCGLVAFQELGDEGGTLRSLSSRQVLLLNCSKEEWLGFSISMTAPP